MVTIGINELVKRQTPDSSFAHFEGTHKELISLVMDNFDKHTKGFREGVLLVEVPVLGFYTSIVELEEGDVFETVFEKRQAHEEAHLKTNVVGKSKDKAGFVEIVLYSHDALAEDNSFNTDSDYEIISINASSEKNIPMKPIAMMRNELGLDGGTYTEYPKEEYLRAIKYWSQHSMIK